MGNTSAQPVMMQSGSSKVASRTVLNQMDQTPSSVSSSPMRWSTIALAR